MGPLTDLVDSTGIDYDTMPRLARKLKADAVTEILGSELRRLCRTIVAATDMDHPSCPRRSPRYSATSASIGRTT